jgi:hypothetical protein
VAQSIHINVHTLYAANSFEPQHIPGSISSASTCVKKGSFHVRTAQAAQKSFFQRRPPLATIATNTKANESILSVNLTDAAGNSLRMLAELHITPKHINRRRPLLSLAQANSYLLVIRIASIQDASRYSYKAEKGRSTTELLTLKVTSSAANSA